MANVKARIEAKCRVCVINDMTDPDRRGPREGRQHIDFIRGETDTIDENDWAWRLQSAQAILLTGEITTYGSYTDDAIGGLFG